MNRFLYISILALVILLSSCKTEHSKLESIINEIIFDEHIDEIKYIIVIPVKGCGYCATTAIDFCKDNYTEPSIKYIITNYVSEKEMKIILSPEIYSHKNIFYDKENKFGKAGFNTMYPIIIKINNKSVYGFEYAEPSKDGTVYSSILNNIEL